MRRTELSRLISAAFVSAVLVRAAPVRGDHDIPGLEGGEATFDAKAPAELEVKRVKTGHLLVRPVINGHEAGWFIFDTGAGICVVSTPHAKELELTAAGDIDAVGTGGGKKAELYKAKTMKLGPLSLTDHPIMTTDLSFLKQHLGEEIAGVIGFGVLSRCVAEIDLETPRVALHDPASFKLTEGKWSKMSLAGRTPGVAAEVEGHKGTFTLDCGANSGITFYAPAVKKWNLLKGRETTEAKIGGVGGFVPVKKGTVEWIELGGVRREDIPADFSTKAKGTGAKSERDGTIGVGLLKYYVMYLDYAGERIALRPHAGADGKVSKGS